MRLAEGALRLAMIKGVGQAEALVEVGLCLGTRRTDFVSYGAEAVPKRRVAVGKGGRGHGCFHFSRRHFGPRLRKTEHCTRTLAGSKRMADRKIRTR